MERTISFRVNTYNSIRCHNPKVIRKFFMLNVFLTEKMIQDSSTINDSDFTKYRKNITLNVCWNFIKKRCHKFFRKHSVLIFILKRYDPIKITITYSKFSNFEYNKFIINIIIEDRPKQILFFLRTKRFTHEFIHSFNTLEKTCNLPSKNSL